MHMELLEGNIFALKNKLPNTKKPKLSLKHSQYNKLIWRLYAKLLIH